MADFYWFIVVNYSALYHLFTKQYILIDWMDFDCCRANILCFCKKKDKSLIS